MCGGIIPRLHDTPKRVGPGFTALAVIPMAIPSQIAHRGPGKASYCDPEGRAACYPTLNFCTFTVVGSGPVAPLDATVRVKLGRFATVGGFADGLP